MISISRLFVHLTMSIHALGVDIGLLSLIMLSNLFHFWMKFSCKPLNLNGFLCCICICTAIILQDYILLYMYIKPLTAIIDSHSVMHHSFADDLQLQMSAPHGKIAELLHSMQSCMSDVEAWATANMLRLNDNMAELMLVTSKRTKHLHNLPTSITTGNAQIPSSSQ